MTRSEFTEKVGRSQKALRRFLTALCCGDSQMADDLAQETFVKAWLTIGNIRNEQAFDAWIRQIAYNTFLNSRRRPREMSLDSSLYESKASTEYEAEREFKYQDLYEALGRLTPKERTSIVLHYLEGYSVKEIARTENLSVDAVKQHLSRGRAHLRHLLKL